jgi:tetratricopeptide (TPR) repeat protein
MVALKTLLDLSPDHEIGRGMLASVYAQLGMWDGAAEHYQRVLAVNAENHLARFQLGMCYLQLGRPADALDMWKPLLRIEGQFLPQFFSGIALIALGRRNEARDWFEQAQAAMPAGHPLQGELRAQLEKLGLS